MTPPPPPRGRTSRRPASSSAFVDWGRLKGSGLSLLLSAIYKNIYKIFFAAITSRFHTVLQEVHLTTAWSWAPRALDDIDQSFKWIRVLWWHSAQTWDFRYSSITTIDMRTFLRCNDFRWSSTLLDGAGSFPRKFGALPLPKAMI
jgi:hypothetical protein